MKRGDLQTIYRSIQVTVTSTPTLILDSDRMRNYLNIQSLGDQYVFVSFGDEDDPAANGQRLCTDGGAYEMVPCPVSAVYMAAVSGSQDVRITVGYLDPSTPLI